MLTSLRMSFTILNFKRRNMLADTRQSQIGEHFSRRIKLHTGDGYANVIG